MTKPVDAATIKDFQRMCTALSKDPHLKLVDKRTEDDYRFRTYENRVTHEYKTIRYIKPRYRK
jgi:hypothetical protein